MCWQNNWFRSCYNSQQQKLNIGTFYPKSGDVAGPRVVENMVDPDLYLEGGECRNVFLQYYHAHRWLRASKNRFGFCQLVGLHEFQQGRLVHNPEMDGMSSHPALQQIDSKCIRKEGGQQPAELSTFPEHNTATWNLVRLIRNDVNTRLEGARGYMHIGSADATEFAGTFGGR